MATESKNIIHSDEERHKCNFCGSVRYESFMRKLRASEARASFRWGNDLKCWACRRECRMDLNSN